MNAAPTPLLTDPLDSLLPSTAPLAIRQRAHSLRVMTYNVRYFGHGTKGVTTTERSLRAIAETIAALDPVPEIIALQEVESRSLRADIGRGARDPQIVRLCTALNAALSAAGSTQRFHGHYFPSHRYTLPAGGPALYTAGLALLLAADWAPREPSAPVAVDITHRRLPLLARLKQTRICAHAALRHGPSGACLDVFNTHLSLPQFLSWASLRFTANMGYAQNQLLEVFNVLDFVAAARRSEHFVLLGDFNSQPGSPVYQQVLDSGLFVDPLASLRALDLAAYRAMPSAGFMHLAMHLDYVFSSPALRWQEFDETGAHGDAHRFAGLSDHSPIIGRLHIPAVSTCTDAALAAPSRASA